MIDINQLQIKTISENTAITPLVMAEWGLSMEISLDNQKILFDTGAGNIDLLRHNMMTMHVDPTEIDTLVLSHGHQDHTGGLRSFLMQRAYKCNRDITIFCHPETLTDKYVKSPMPEAYRFFGCPFTAAEITRYNAKFSFSAKPIHLTDTVMTSGEVPMTNDYEDVGLNFFIKKGADYHLDTEMIDDLALLIKTNLGLIIILGCAHRGMINTIHHAKKISGIDDIFMVLGGTHLANATKERLDKTIAEIKSLKIQKVGVSHCTGFNSAAYLQNALGPDIFFHNNAGTIIRFKEERLVAGIN